MSEALPQSGHLRRYWLGLIGALLTLLALGMALGYYYYYDSGIGLAQPIAFSHHFHVSTKNVNCIFCHPTAIDTPRAGVPPVATCMLCHQHVAIHYPEIEKVRAHWAEQRPIQWRKIAYIPDFVFFNHQVHLQRAVDCGRCHGDVSMMDCFVQNPQLTMGFCVQCHRDEQATVDCWSCHR